MSLAEQLQRNPRSGEQAFSRLAGALDQVVTRYGDRYDRYREFAGAGLAVVVARDGQPIDSYNPFDLGTVSRLSFMDSNQRQRPGLWAPQPIDAQSLGGKVPQSLGRFTAYALAKLNNMTYNGQHTSHEIDNKDLGLGRFGNAGGQLIGRTLIGFSGLWEIHDHIAGHYFDDEAKRELNPELDARTDEELVEVIDRAFGEAHAMHNGQPVAELSRSFVHGMVLEIDEMLAFNRAA